MKPIVYDLRVYLSLADDVSVLLLSPLVPLCVEVQRRRQSTHQQGFQAYWCGMHTRVLEELIFLPAGQRENAERGC